MKRYVVLIACCALLAAGCGRSDGAEGAGPTDDGSSSSSAPPTTGTDDASFGDLTDVCQPGSPSGAPTTGVTADSIRVAVFSDAGFTGRPGLNQEFFDTADVFASWCNEHGGINGRTIVVDQRDAALTNVAARMFEACADDFVMVGGGATFDADGVEPRLKCLLPDVAGFVASAKARGADLLIQPQPNPLSALGIGNLRYLGKKYPDSTAHVGILTGDLPLTKEVADDNAAAVRSLDWDISFQDVYPPAGISDWTLYAQKVKDTGTKGLVWVGEPEGLAKLIVSLRDIGYPLDWIRADANHYDQSLIDIAGPALTNAPAYVQISMVPFDDAPADSATRQYLDLFERYKPNGKNRTALGVTAFSAWLLFAKAASSCGDDLTRQCFVDAAEKIHEWTGGGLHAASDPGAGTATNCFAALKAEPGGFELMTDTKPNDGIFTCDEKNVFELTDNIGTETTLEDVGQSIENLK